MAEVVNLRQFRKQKKRADKAREAEASRAAHGRTKAERSGQNAEREKLARHVEGHKRDSGSDT